MFNKRNNLYHNDGGRVAVFQVSWHRCHPNASTGCNCHVSVDHKTIDWSHERLGRRHGSTQEIHHALFLCHWYFWLHHADPRCVATTSISRAIHRMCSLPDCHTGRPHRGKICRIYAQKPRDRL